MFVQVALEGLGRLAAAQGEDGLVLDVFDPERQTTVWRNRSYS